MERSRAYRLILLLGVVSLLGDIIYEGCRGVVGPYLALLGASASAIGFVSGLGEFFGFALRLPFGYLSDRTANYWGLTIAGYALLFSIPLLALVGDWRIAMLLLLVERAGKALRSPARDTILSHATLEVGAGKGFAIHEILDQVGAIAGPLLFSFLLLVRSYRAAFLVTLFPLLLLLLFLLLAKRTFPTAAPKAPAEEAELRGSLGWYNFFVFVSVAGLLPFPLLAYHLKTGGVMTEPMIPLAYAFAMMADALSAYPIGMSFDRVGLVSLSVVPFLSMLVPLAFLGYPACLLGVLAYGLVLGAHETVMRAAVAKLAPAGRRGRAYGSFQAIYGLSFLLGNTLAGFLYERGISLLVLYVFLAEVLSLPVLVRVLGSRARRSPSFGSRD
jgi:MFS family permease